MKKRTLHQRTSQGNNRRNVRTVNSFPGFIRGFFMGVALVGIFGGIPYLPIGLKALGFMRYDFIPSTSGAVMETTATLPFRFLIGNQQDEAMQTTVILSDGSIRMLLKEQKISASDSDPTTTPSGSLLPSIQQPALDASSSAQIASPSGHTALREAYEELRAIEQSHATLSARIASLSAQIDTLLEEGQQIYAEVLQSNTKPRRIFDGPIETVRQEGRDVRVSYHRDRTDIVETISITNPDIEALVFELTNTNYRVRIAPSQTWEIILSDAIQMQIVSTVKSGADAPLPVVEEQHLYPSDTGHAIRFLLPKRVRTEGGFAPLVLERRYIRKGITQTSVEERIRMFTGSDDTVPWSTTGPFVDRVIPTASSTAILHEVEGDTYTTSDDHIDLQPYLGGEPLTALSCHGDSCAAVRNDTVYPFLFTDLKAASDAAQFFGTLQPYRLTHAPVGEIALGGDALFYTSAQAPMGGVYRRSKNGTEERISDVLSFPSHLSVTPDGTGIAYWAEGKIHVLVKGTSGTTVPLDDEPVDVAIGPDYSVYCILPVLSAQTRMIVRISLGLSAEVLPGKTGKITALLAHSDGLGVAMNMTDLGVYMQIPWNKLEWIPLVWDSSL